MMDGFLGLRHDAVVGRHHQDDQVGGFGAAGAHGGERLVARRIEEGDHAARRLDVVGADVLGDAAGLAVGDARLADVVEQGGLAMVDVAHDSHHGRARLQDDVLLVHFLRFGKQGIRIVELGGLGDVSHFLDHDHRGLLVEDLVDGDHRSELHQHLDHFGGLDRHLVCQVGNGNGLRHQHLAHDRF